MKTSNRPLQARILILALPWILIIACDGGMDDGGHDHDGHAGHGGHDAHAEDPEEAHSSEHPIGEVHLDPHVIERNGITTEKVKRRLLLGALEVPAEVQVNPDRTAHVASLVPGRLAGIEAALGDDVEKGEVLAVVHSVELGRVRSELSGARSRKRAADAELQRVELLADEGISAKKAVIEARARAKSAAADVSAARASLETYGGKRRGGSELSLRSPISGTVIERHASPGEVVDTSASRFVVADLSEVWVMGRVYEQELSQISTGMPAEVALIAYPGQTWAGTVDYVSSTLDEDTRTVSIRVVLANTDRLLRPGLFGTIAVGRRKSSRESQDSEVLSVPSSAVSTIGDRTVVFIVGDEPGSFVARDVIPGSRAHGLIEIREGLVDGQEIVSNGAFVLKSELLKSSIGDGHAH